MPTFKYLDSPISTDMVQILMLLYRPLQRNSSTGGPYHPAHVLCRPCVQQPQAEHRLSLVRQRQHEGGVLLLQCSGLGGQQGLV